MIMVQKSLIPQDILERIEKDFYLFKEFIERHFGREVFEGDRPGGYFSMGIQGDIEAIPVAQVPEEKKEKYYSLSIEKNMRAFFCFKKYKHITSYQSRNITAKVYNLITNQRERWGQWGGAIVVIKDGQVIVFSFSGLPELLDEAFMVWTAFHYEYIDYKGICEFAALRHDNPYIQTMCAHFGPDLFTE